MALAIYDLAAVAASLLDVPRRAPLAVEVRAPLWFDTMGIDYRWLMSIPACANMPGRAGPAAGAVAATTPDAATRPCALRAGAGALPAAY